MSKFSSINQPKHKRTGRPKGSHNKTTQAIKRRGARFIDMVFDKALDDTNVDQAKYCSIAAKFISPAKSVMPEFSINETGKNMDSKEGALLIIKEMFRGNVSSDVALAALQTVAASSNLIDIKELEAKIDELLAERGLEVA